MSRSHSRTPKQERREKKRREAIAAHPRRLAHETMMVVAPPWALTVRKLIERMRPPPGALPVLAEEQQIGSDPEFLEMLDGRFALETQGFGWSRRAAAANMQCLCTLAECAINYEIGGRKAFWVDGALAELLSQTTLDDIGYVQQSREEMEVLFTFLAERYERRSVQSSPATSSSASGIGSSRTR